MLKDKKRNKNGFVNRLLSKRLALGISVMLLMATIVSVGVAAVAGAEGCELLVSIKGNKPPLPSLSPDFKKVAYTTFSDENKSYELWVMNVDGRNLRKIGEWTGVAIVMGWSKDGGKILCWVLRREGPEYLLKPGDSTLWIINSDGTGKKQIAEDFGLDRIAILSPDGDKVAYSKYGGGTSVVNIDGSGNKFITRDGLPLSWRPDGKRIIIGGYSGGIKEIDIDSGVERLLNATLPYGIVISPDGSKMAYHNHGIWVSDIDGSNPRQLTYSEKGTRDSFSWSPDSKRIAFITEEEGIHWGIWVINSDGSHQKKVGSFDITRGIAWWSQGRMSSLIWNQDGNKIAYAYEKKQNDQNFKTDIYTINIGEPSFIKPPASETQTEKQPGIQGFETIFAIAGLLTVAYFLRRRR